MFEVREPCEITTWVQKGAIIVAIGFRITWVQNITIMPKTEEKVFLEKRNKI